MTIIDTPKTHKRWVHFSFATALFVLLLAGAFSTSRAQSVAGRIAFGFDGGGNKYYGNFSDNQFGFSGDAFIRWNILDWLSLHAAYNGGVLHYSVTDVNKNANPGYFGSPGQAHYDAGLYPDGITKLDDQSNIRVGGWELMLSANVFPSQSFVPYFIAGIEALNFEPKTAHSAQPLPNNAAGIYSKNVLGGEVGVGYELYISDKVTFNGKVLLHLTGTDWLDDYSDPNNFRQDAFMTFGMGFAYYIFAPDLDKTPNAAAAVAVTTQVDQTNYVHQTTIIKSDTIYIREAADTVYMMNPKVNTVYNFPGTLFIVNTDQFNTAVPGNQANLYKIRDLVNQCPALKVEIQGFASEEGTPQRNQELSELRAAKIKSWLIGQGISPDKVPSTVGYGTSRPAVIEPTNGSPERLEAARVQNRRIAVRVLHSCTN